MVPLVTLAILHLLLPPVGLAISDLVRFPARGCWCCGYDRRDATRCPECGALPSNRLPCDAAFKRAYLVRAAGLVVALTPLLIDVLIAGSVVRFIAMGAWRVPARISGLFYSPLGFFVLGASIGGVAMWLAVAMRHRWPVALYAGLGTMSLGLSSFLISWLWSPITIRFLPAIACTLALGTIAVLVAAWPASQGRQPDAS